MHCARHCLVSGDHKRHQIHGYNKKQFCCVVLLPPVMSHMTTDRFKSEGYPTLHLKICYKKLLG